MPRGRSSESFTGGSGDVNPQTMVMQTTQTGNDASTVTGLGLPIPRLPIKRGRSLVIELLDINFVQTTAPAVANGSLLLAILTTNPTVFANTTAALTDPRVIGQWYKWASQLTGVGVLFTPVEKYVDLTDAAGHGILVGTDNLYLAVYTAATGVANEVVARLSYRFKDVSLEEYIGIVQSQQG